MVIPVIHVGDGKCIECIELYKKAFDAEVEYITYPGDVPGSEIYKRGDGFQPIIHSQLIISGTKFNLSDNDEQMIRSNMVCFNIFFSTKDEMRQAYETLAIEGEIENKIEPQFWAALYAVVVDKFGVRWQMMVE